MSEHTRPFSRRAFVGGAAAFGISLCLPALTPTPAHAVTAAEKQAEANAALEKLNAMQEKLDRASDAHFEAVEERKAAEARMDEAQGRIDDASSRISELQGQLGDRARSMYRSGSSTFLDLLLGSTTFQAFASNWDLLNDMNENDANMVEETKTLRAEVESEKAVYAEQRDVADKKAKEAEEVEKEANALVDQMTETYNSLSAEAAELLRQEEEAREAAAREAARRAEEEMRRQAEAEEAAARERQQSNGGGNSDSSNDGGGNNDSSDDGSSDDEPKPSSSGNSKPQSVSGNTVVDRAYGELGKPYAWGAVGPNSYDCSGLVSYCLTGSHSRLGTTGTFMGWTHVSNPQPGDICVNSHHCGIYIGDGQMIHAPRTGDVVKVSGVHSGMVYVRY
ncbi:coiled-coil domain-containing protein [Adlercreutzia caecimuris]|jgi:peptidoglycan hydrolase CwlO-like protein|uniref:coiled-coil domain-containing protein n=1 Tax=Adlercreutzia caecimuris TaxID=671266 RepID=UPI00257126BA|nr:NlpC/P60 family protein [Adlercreutzia caecimuris]